MQVVFHGENAGAFSEGLADLLDFDAEVSLLPDTLRPTRSGSHISLPM